jgi:hypothetical protein
MSATVEAPSQFKQPSRKGKKAWRKNVDVTEVQEGLRLLKDEEIKGYVPSNGPGLSSRKPFPDLYADIIPSVQWCSSRKAFRRTVRHR